MATNGQIFLTIFIVVAAVGLIGIGIGTGFSINASNMIEDLSDALLPSNDCTFCPPKCLSTADCITIISPTYTIFPNCEGGYCSVDFAFGNLTATKSDTTDQFCKDQISTVNPCLNVYSVGDCGGQAAGCSANFPCQIKL